MLHPIRRINPVNRGDLALVRQIESAIPSWPVRCPSSTLTGMTKPDPTLAQIAARFTRHN